MNIFRSEDDVRSWDIFDPTSADAIRPVAEYFALFSTDLFTKRLTPDYLEHLPTYVGATFGAFAAMGDDPFWEPPAMG